MHRLLLLLFVTVFAGVAEAQRPDRANRPAPERAESDSETGTLLGTVEDAESGAVLVGATVAVWRDSSLVTGAITDPDGAFRVEGVRLGTYRVVVSFVGYQPSVLPEWVVEAGERDLGVFALIPGDETLADVVVDAERSSIEIDIDRIIYNVADDPIAQGGNVTDVLETIPSVDVDVDGNVSLRGVSNVAILIDGRPAPVGRDFIGAYLQSLPAGAIERIEVLPNPSAKYEPDGIGGIVNVVLKENTQLGLGGALTAGGDTQGGANVTSLVTLGRGKWDLTATAGLRRSVRESTGDRFRVNRFQFPETTLDQAIEDESARSSALLAFNADYVLSRTTSLTANVNGGLRASDGDEFTTFIPDGEPDIAFDRLADESSDGANAGVRLGLRWDADGQRGQRGTEGRRERGARGGRRGGGGGGRGGRGRGGSASLGEHTLVADVRLRTSTNGGTDLFTEEDLGGILARERSETDGATTSLSMNLDYARPLTEAVRLEAGTRLESDRRSTERLFFRDIDGTFLLDPTQSTLFDQNQQQAAVYVQARAQLGDLGVQAGVRGEATQTTFEPNGGTPFEYDDAGFFPSAFASYQLSNQTVVRASYSRRINRPRSRYLDPTPSVDDPINIRVGNPELRPEYTDALEASVLQILPFGSLSVTPYWRRTSDVIRRFQEIRSDGVTISTFENLDTATSGGVEAVVSFQDVGGISGLLSVEGFRTVTDGSSVDADLEADAFGWGGRLNLRYSLTSTTDLQGTARYRAPMNTEQGRIGARQFVDLALSQRLTDRARLALRFRDPFGTAGFSSVLDQPRLYQEFDRALGRQQIAATLTYTFGSADEREARQANRQGAAEEGVTGDLDIE
ncbi:MAG: TonB-dependent receptor [Bacteroidota bacterium]